MPTPRHTRCGAALLGAASVLLAMAGATALQAASLFGLTDTGELFTSADAGVTWTVQGTLPVSDAQAIAAGETSDELFLASRGGVVYRSADAGVNWSAVGAVAASDVVEMGIRNNGDVYLLSETGTVWQSTDDGATFGALSTLTAPNHVSMTGGEPGDLYTVTRTGEVAKSTDFGTTWAVVGAITTSEAIDIRALGPSLYVITGPGDVYQSDDAAVSWLAVGTVSQVHMTGLTTHEGGLVAVSREGLVASSGDATSWTFVGSINQLNVVAIGNDTPQITNVDQTGGVPSLRVRSVWPNPVRGRDESVTIAFEAPERVRVTTRIYDVRGRVVMTHDAGAVGASGSRQFRLPVGGLSSGVYYVRLDANTGTHTHAKLAIRR